MNTTKEIISINETSHASDGSDSKTVTCASPKAADINLKRSDEKETDHEAVPPAKKLSMSENSMKLKMEATKKKLEQRYGEEAEKKGKKKVQLIDDPKSLGGVRRRRGGGCSKVKAKDKAKDSTVKERVVATLKRLKNTNEKPKYSVYTKKDIYEEN